MEIVLIIGGLLFVAVAAHEYRLKRLSDKARRDGKEAADYAGIGLFLGLGAHNLHDGPHDHANQVDHMDTMGPGDGMSGE